MSCSMWSGIYVCTRRSSPRTEQRCEEANAVAAAAIERREREEKAGWRRFRSAGRVLLDAESERDRYRDQLDDRKRELEERTKERDKARSEGSKLGESARTAAQEHGKEREAARVAGRADGRREAGAALDRILSGAQGLLERVPVLGQRLGRLVAALRSGDADEGRCRLAGDCAGGSCAEDAVRSCTA